MRLSTEGSSAGVVVVIEDDESARDLLTRVLENEGYQVATAINGKEGLELVRELKPMAVTLDVLMPQMDGWQTLNALKADPELSEIPAILVSMLDEKKRGFALGADHYLTKPIHRAELVSLLQPYCDGEVKPTCLLVEDHEPTRQLVDRILRKEGWRVLQATDGGQGLEVAQRERIDLVLLDLMMPNMDGFEFLRRFRREERFANLPVVVCTAKDLSADEITRLEEDTARIIEKTGRRTGEIMSEIRRSLQLIGKE
jgi:CheY-like chemotaxis protein